MLFITTFKYYVLYVVVVLCLYRTSRFVFQFDLKHMSNELCCNVTMARMSLCHRNFNLFGPPSSMQSVIHRNVMQCMTVYLFFHDFSSSLCLFCLRVFISLITLFICPYMPSILSIVILNMSHNYLNFLPDNSKIYVLSDSGSDNCFVSSDYFILEYTLLFLCES